MPIQMPEPLELMTLSANRMPCTKSASEKRYSGAISTAQFHEVEEGVAGDHAIAGLDERSTAAQIAHGVVQDGKAIAVGGGAGHNVVEQHVIEAAGPACEFHLRAASRVSAN